jgi:hypothetical protein
MKQSLVTHRGAEAHRKSRDVERIHDGGVPTPGPAETAPISLRTPRWGINSRYRRYRGGDTR